MKTKKYSQNFKVGPMPPLSSSRGGRGKTIKGVGNAPPLDEVPWLPQIAIYGWGTKSEDLRLQWVNIPLRT